jgi:putative spermidine/putrescine transport system permease protein
MGWKFPLTGIMAWSAFAFLLLPSLIIVPISFGNRNQIVFPPTEFHWDLYYLFFTTSTWIAATTQSAKVALLSTAIALTLGTLAAYGIERSRMRGKQLLLVVLLSPLLIPGVVTALGLYSYFAAIGLSGSTTALVMGHAVFLCPFVIVTVSAGMKELDGSIETAASVMGAGRLKIFTAVVLPQLRPSLVGAGLFAFLMSFDELVISWFISGAQTTTLPVKMYSSVQTETSPILAAISTMLTILSVIICLGAEGARNLRKKAVAADS